jgi:hypothetical protein
MLFMLSLPAVAQDNEEARIKATVEDLLPGRTG